MISHWMRTRSILAAVGVSAFLSACGGGGGEAIVASTLDFSVKPAYVKQFNEAKALPFSLSGTVSGVAVSATGTMTRGAPSLSTFESQPAQRKVTTITGSMVSNGVTTPFATTVNEYVDGAFDPVGLIDSEYEVVVGKPAIPLVAKVGDSGVIYTANRYSSSTKVELVGTATYSYLLEAATATTATLKIIEVAKDKAGVLTETNTVVFEITAGGVITRKSETSVIGKDTLTVVYAS